MVARVITPDTPQAPGRLRRILWQFFDRYLTSLSLVGMIGLLVLILLYPFIAFTVPSGHAAVLWKRFGGGTVLDPQLVLGEGFHLIFPWDKAFLYDLRLQSRNETFKVITKDGIGVSVSTTVRFSVPRKAVPALHQEIGPDYVRVVLVPEIGNKLREVIANYTAEQLYSTDRSAVQTEVIKRTEERLIEMEQTGVGSGYVTLYDALLLQIDLPEAVVAAIERKLSQYYLTQEYDFRIQREQKEAEIKRIQGEGIRNFQQTVGEGISESYLRLRGIDATVQLAQSSNAKTVIIGAGKDGLPLILNGAVSEPTPQLAQPTAGTRSEATTDPPAHAVAGTAATSQTGATSVTNRSTTGVEGPAQPSVPAKIVAALQDLFQTLGLSPERPIEQQDGR